MTGKSFTIAIDGPAASGKGTLARRLAEHFGFHHLDSGLTYRAVGHALLDAGLPLDNEDLAVIVAENIDLGALDREILSAHEIGNAASKVAVMGEVRKVLVKAPTHHGPMLPAPRNLVLMVPCSIWDRTCLHRPVHSHLHPDVLSR